MPRLELVETQRFSEATLRPRTHRGPNALQCGWSPRDLKSWEDRRFEQASHFGILFADHLFHEAEQAVERFLIALLCGPPQFRKEGSSGRKAVPKNT